MEQPTVWVVWILTAGKQVSETLEINLSKTVKLPYVISNAPFFAVHPKVPFYSGSAGVLGEQACGSDPGSSDEWSRSSGDGPVLHERRCFCKWCHSCKYGLLQSTASHLEQGSVIRPYVVVEQLSISKLFVNATVALVALGCCMKWQAFKRHVS